MMQRLIFWLLITAIVLLGGWQFKSYWLPTLNRGEERQAAGHWQSGAALPTPRTEVAAALYDEEIYILGGLTESGQASTRVERYRPSTDSWSSAPDLPVTLHHAAAITYDNVLYVVGGFTTNNQPTDTTYYLNEAGTAWEVDPSPLPKAVAAYGLTSDQGVNVALLGGTDDDGDSRAAYILSELDLSWEQLPDLSIARNHLAAAWLGGKLYAIGGRTATNSTIALGVVDSYDTVTKQWQVSPLLPRPTSGMGVVTVKDKLYVIGGESGTSTLDAVQIFDPIHNRWSLGKPMPTKRHGAGVVAYQDKIYVIGGGPTAGQSVTGSVEIYTP